MPRRGGVLADDEPAGRDAADGELLVAFDLRRLDVDVLDRGRRAGPLKDRLERVDRVGRALGVHAHRPVAGVVAHPAQDAEVAGAPHGEVAEADALHVAVDGGADRGRARRHGRSSRVAPAPSASAHISATASASLRPCSRVSERQVANASAWPIAARVRRVAAPRAPRPATRMS